MHSPHLQQKPDRLDVAVGAGGHQRCLVVAVALIHGNSACKRGLERLQVAHLGRVTDVHVRDACADERRKGNGHYTPYSKMARSQKRAGESNLITRQRANSVSNYFTASWMITMSQNCCLSPCTEEFHIKYGRQIIVLRCLAFDASPPCNSPQYLSELG